MDSNWNAFAQLCREKFEACTFQAELIGACRGQEDIAWVAYFHMGDDAVKWMHRAIPALDDHIPVSLIDESKGDEVRHCLWSFPY